MLLREGMVDHEILAQGFASSGFILYPTTFPETGCITLMKAQAMGAIPITSRHRKSTLQELTGPYDLGPRELAGDTYAEDPEWPLLWLEAVVQASNRDYEERQQQKYGGKAGGDSLQALRQDMIRAARARFSWATVARIWMDKFAETLSIRENRGEVWDSEWSNSRRR